MMRLIPLAAMLVMSISSVSPAAMTPRGQAVVIACTGAIVAEGRAIAKSDGLKHGQHPKACFGKMQIYDGPDSQFVVAVPQASCPGGRAIDVYGRSRAGSWYSYFERPVCGAALSIGPKNPWGDWMLTIDGKHYDSRGAYYVPVNY